MDSVDTGTISYINTVGLRVPDGVPGRVTSDGKTFAVFHGHEPGFDRAIDTLNVDYILHGHTHVASSHSRGRTRIINPGALHRTRRPSVATLDTMTGTVTFHDIRDT